MQSGLSDGEWREAILCSCYLKYPRFIDRRTNTVREEISRTARRSDPALTSRNSFKPILNEPTFCRRVWEDMEKDVATEVHVDTLKSREVEVDTCGRTCMLPCADGSINHEGHAEPRPPRFRPQQEDESAGGRLRSKTPAASQCGRRHRVLPSVKIMRRTMSWALQSMSFTATALLLAVSSACPVNRRSPHL